jgi:hypothetical protein
VNKEDHRPGRIKGREYFDQVSDYQIAKKDSSRWSLWTYVRMYIYAFMSYVGMCRYESLCMNAYMYVCEHVSMYVCMYVCMCVSMLV